jgi:multisubunit Na+/H+ antiporter MnhB subunit
MKTTTLTILGFIYLKCNSIIMLIIGLSFLIIALYFILHFINEIYINKKFFNENIININNFCKFLSF